MNDPRIVTVQADIYIAVKTRKPENGFTQSCHIRTTYRWRTDDVRHPWAVSSQTPGNHVIRMSSVHCLYVIRTSSIHPQSKQLSQQFGSQVLSSQRAETALLKMGWTHVFLCDHGYHCLELMVMSPLSFEARVGCLFHTLQRYVMYDPKDSPLVQHLPTSWCPTCVFSAEVGLDDLLHSSLIC